MSLRMKFMSGFAALAMVSGAMFVTTALTAPDAAAQSAARVTVNAAIKAGKIGETAAGYLETVSGASLSSAERGAMNEINIGRKSHYTKLAETQGVSIEVVAAITGEKLIAKAPSGSKIMTTAGRWMTK